MTQEVYNQKFLSGLFRAEPDQRNGLGRQARQGKASQGPPTAAAAQLPICSTSIRRPKSSWEALTWYRRPPTHRKIIDGRPYAKKDRLAEKKKVVPTSHLQTKIKDKIICERQK